MANGSTEEWIVKLQDSLTDLKLTATNLDTKLDQLTLGLTKLETAMDSIKNVTSNQETRLQLLESHCARIPERLNEDFALMKSQLRSYRQFLWMSSTVLVGLILKTLYDSVVGMQ